MRITGNQLRRIIRETILNEDERRRAEMMAAVEKEIDFKKEPLESGHGITKSFRFPAHKSYEERRKEEGRAVTERRLKRLWNKYADHEFFDQKLAKLHVIGLYARTATSCLDFLDACAGKVNRDEISALGWRESKLTTGWAKSEGFTFAVFIDGRVTYAAAADLGTEWTSNATEADRQRHASSGLPKRPYYVDNPSVADSLVLDEEDWVNRIESPHRGSLQEVIVDNWRIKSLVVSSSSREGYRIQQDAWQTDDFLISVVNKCKQLGIPIMDETGTVYYSPSASFDEDWDGDWGGNEDLSRGLA